MTDQLSIEVGVIADLLSAASLLAWDMRTTMPPGGVETRGEQLATLAQLARERLLGGDMERALDGAEGRDGDRQRAVATIRAAIAHHRRIPPALMRERSRVRAVAQAAWADARSRDDFALFAPHLERTVVLARELAEAVGYEEHPHDALLAQFEPGATYRTLQPLFAELQAALGPLRRRVLERPAPEPLPAGEYPVPAQQRFVRGVAERFGYDFARGRLDPTTHPFELAMTRNDVRITARYNAQQPSVGLKATMHEVGHGLYEQGIDPALTRTALALDLFALSSMAGASLGVHESQSRLWENHVGRSLGFWRHAYPELQAAFPQLGAVGLEAFHRAFNAVERGQIRTEADELSYDFHIMLRTELERALIDGSLRVADLPAAWNAAMRRDLDVVVESDAEGVLQDIHWSMGQFGSFCSYTVGNMLAAQVFAAVEGDPGVAEGLEQGAYGPLREALTERIYRHGRRFEPPELIERATGQPLTAEPYIRYLTEKYEALYRL